MFMKVQMPLFQLKSKCHSKGVMLFFELNLWQSLPTKNTY